MSKKPGDFGKLDRPGKLPALKQLRQGDRASPKVPRIDPGFLSDDQCGQIHIPDPFREKIPTQGRQDGEVVLYDAAQTYNYPSQSARYERSLRLAPNRIYQRDGKNVYCFCSSRSPTGYWEVSELGVCTYVDTGGKILYLLCPPTGYHLSVDTDCDSIKWTQISGRAVILDPPDSPNPELIILDDLSSREPIILRASLPEDPLIADDLVIRTTPTEEITPPSSSELLSGSDASPLLKVSIVRETPGEPETAFQWASGSIPVTWDLPTALPIFETRWQKNTTGQYEDVEIFPVAEERSFDIELGVYYRILSVFDVNGTGASAIASRTFVFAPNERVLATSRMPAPCSASIRSIATDYPIGGVSYQYTDIIAAPASTSPISINIDYPLGGINLEQIEQIEKPASTAIDSICTSYELGGIIIG
jgi:hypothetical protein